MNTLHPKRIEAAMSAAMQALAELDQADERLRLDTVEGQSDVFEIIDRLIEDAIADDALIDQGKQRLARIERRAANKRRIARDMLLALDLADEAIERPLHTTGITWHQHVIVTDEDQLPGDCVRVVPDKRRIGALLHKGEPVTGAVLSNPEPTLTVRLK
jgi:hypothetical protein